MQTGALKIPHTVSFLSMLECLKFQYLISNLESFRTKSYLACLFVLWVGAFCVCFWWGFLFWDFRGFFGLVVCFSFLTLLMAVTGWFSGKE